MSRYAQPADLANFGLQNQATQGITAAVLQTHLDNASNVADSYLNARYNLPLQSWPTSLTEAVCKIAAFNTLVYRGFNPADGPDVLTRKRFDDAVKWLEGIAAGKIEPVGMVDASTTAEPGGPFVVQARFSYNTQGSSLQTLGGFPSSQSFTPSGRLTIGPPVMRGW